MLLSFVFSFRNEGENIVELVRRVDEVTAAVDDLQYEMIFVNDGSTDHSVALLLALQKRYPIVIINMSRQFGVTPCVLAGFAHSKGDAVVYMDADLQDPPELIPEMIKKFRNGAEVVHTTRIAREGESAVKMWATKKAYRLINYFSDIHLPENTGDFKLLSAKVVKQILNLKEYDPYMRGVSVWVGYQQDYVFYQRKPRFAGVSKFSFLSRGPLREFIRGLTAYSATPLYLSFVLGVMSSLFAVGIIFYAVLTKLLGLASQGTSSILIAIAFFNGIVLMTHGITGLYIARIYDEVKGRPRYIVSSILKPNNSSLE
jgi:polyisoprenyl-phosphate glycosyltransferase